MPALPRGGRRGAAGRGGDVQGRRLGTGTGGGGGAKLSERAGRRQNRRSERLLFWIRQLSHQCVNQTCMSIYT